MPKEVGMEIKNEIVEVLLKGFHISEEPEDLEKKVAFWKTRATVFQLALHCYESYFVSENQFLQELRNFKTTCKMLTGNKLESEFKIKRKR